MKIKDLKLNENMEITRFLYKPGWSIKFIRMSHHDMYEIIIMHQTNPDASKFKDPGNYQDIVRYWKTPLQLRSSIYEDSFKQMKEIDFWNYLFEQVRSAEMHEIKEWFKIDGKYLKNPHPGDFVPGIPEIECFTS